MTTLTMTPSSHIDLTAPRPRLLTGPVVRLLLADFAAMSSFYLLLSVVPLWSTERGIGGLGAGLSTAVLMFAAVAAELATPRLASRIGYRRLLMAGLVLLGAPALLLPVASGLVPLMGVCVVRGFGFAIVVVTVGALMAETIPAERRGEGLGVMGVVTMLPAVVALPLGVWLVSAVGYSWVFVAGALVSLVAVPLLCGLPDDASEAADSEGIVAGLRNPALTRPMLIFAVTAVASGVVVAFLPGAVADGNVVVVGLFLQAATATLARWLAGRHADRHGASRLLIPSVVVTAAGLALAALTGSTIAVLIGMAVFGVGFGAAQSATLNAMLERVPRSEYGAVSAAWNVAYDLGWGVGAAGIGVVVASAGHSTAFAMTAALVCAAVPLARRSASGSAR